jgi:hypothetical protein
MIDFVTCATTVAKVNAPETTPMTSAIVVVDKLKFAKQ